MSRQLPYSLHDDEDGYAVARAMAFDPENGLSFVVDVAAENRHRAREHLSIVMDALGYDRFELVRVDDVDHQRPSRWEPEPGDLPARR